MKKLLYMAGFVGIYASCLADITEGGIYNTAQFTAHLTITVSCSGHGSTHTQEIPSNGFYELDVNSGCTLKITGYLLKGNTQINLLAKTATISGERYRVTIQPKNDEYEIVGTNY